MIADFDAETVIARLEDAGRTLLALPHTGVYLGYRMRSIEVVRTLGEIADALPDGTPRPAVPSAHAVTLMDEAFGWIHHIPAPAWPLQPHMRYVVGLRLLVSPINGRHIWTWRKIGDRLHTSHEHARRLHARGIEHICAALRSLPLRLAA